MQHTEEAASLFRACLRRFFQELSPAEHQIRVDVEEYAEATDLEDAGLRTPLHFHLLDGLDVEGCLVVGYEAGNVYDVTARLAYGYETKQAVGLPAAALNEEGAQTQINHLGRRLLAELERVAGERSMQLATAEKAAGGKASEG